VKAGRQQPDKSAQEAVILFTVGEFRLAIAAGAVREIRGLEGLQPRESVGGLPLRVPKVGFVLERNGMVWFVVDAARHFHLPASPSPQRVLVLRNFPVAILADSTDRMMEISVLHELPLAFTGDERNWYRGLAVMEGDVVPVVNHATFLSKGEQILLKAALENAATTNKAAV
jgi:chemotaxis signal transduction protein